MAFSKTGVSFSSPVQIKMHFPEVGASRVVKIGTEEVQQFWDGKKWANKEELPQDKVEEWQKA